MNYMRLGSLTLAVVSGSLFIGGIMAAAVVLVSGCSVIYFLGVHRRYRDRIAVRRITRSATRNRAAA